MIMLLGERNYYLDFPVLISCPPLCMQKNWSQYTVKEFSRPSPLCCTPTSWTCKAPYNTRLFVLACWSSG
jgi:hypothetical protein